MTTSEKIKRELRALLLTTAYFAAWIGTLMGMKVLILAEYKIAFQGLSKALIGALILSKVVLILEHLPLGSWVRRQPAWMDVALRTLFYSGGVLIVLILEKGIEGRHGDGGFAGAVSAACRATDAAHVWLNTICVAGALLVFNIAAVVRSHLGRGGLLKLLLVPLPGETPSHSTGNPPVSKVP
jgi:hypothetical protein